MTDIVFRFDIDAPPHTVLEALKTKIGIESFWTSSANVPVEVGDTLMLDFAPAPAPFDLQLEQSDERTVAWRTVTFPPHWVGSTIRWDVEPREAGSTVVFCHAGLTNAEDAGHAAYTWGQIMVQLKEYAETGIASPVFT